MVVGEAPSPEDDIKGRPFVGRAGTLLHEALASLGVTEYYATTTVKCCPPGALTSSHVAACKGYLRDEIQTVRPKVILALGNTSWHYFGDGPITEHAGREVWREDLGAWIVPALSPSVVLRFPERKKAWLLDISRFAAVARGERVTEIAVDVEVVTDPIAFGASFSDRHGQPLTYDFETNAKDWWRTDFAPVSIAFSWSGDKSYVLPLNEDPEREAAFFRIVRPYMENPKQPKSPWNMLLDDLVWYRLSGYLPYCTFDPMVGIQLLDENQPKGLKWQGRARLGWPNWDIGLKAKTGAENDEARARLYRYNGLDTAATWLLRGKILFELSQEPRLLAYLTRLEMPKLRALERLIANGVHVDQERLAGRLAAAATNLLEARTRVPVENPNSTKQLRDWLYGTLRLTPPKLTPTGAPSTDEESVLRLAQQHPEIRPILEVRKWQKIRSTYLEPTLTATEASIDGRIHPEYRSTSVETGRLASSFHTTPRDSFVRSIYDAPPGWSLVQGDYAQIEARLAAWKAVGMPATFDPMPVLTLTADGVGRTMLAAWLAGLDVYVETAAEILRKKPSEVNRDKSDSHNERQIVGKVVTLALLYCMTAKGLREYLWREEEIEWTQHQAEQAYQGFYRRWPEFALWHEREERILQVTGYSESPIGRRRRLPAAMQADSGRQAYQQIREAINAGINQPIQSVAADITQTSMILLQRHLDALEKKERRELREYWTNEWLTNPVPKTWEPPFKIVGSIHDALLFEVRDECLPEILPFIRRVMEHAPSALKPLGLNLPAGLIKVELSVGAWGLGKEWKE